MHAGEFKDAGNAGEGCIGGHAMHDNEVIVYCGIWRHLALEGT